MCVGAPRCALSLRRPHDAGHEARDGAEERRRQVDPVADEVVGDEREGGDVEGDACAREPRTRRGSSAERVVHVYAWEGGGVSEG